MLVFRVTTEKTYTLQLYTAVINQRGQYQSLTRQAHGADSSPQATVPRMGYAHSFISVAKLSLAPA